MSDASNSSGPPPAKPSATPAQRSAKAADHPASDQAEHHSDVKPVVARRIQHDDAKVIIRDERELAKVAEDAGLSTDEFKRLAPGRRRAETIVEAKLSDFINPQYQHAPRTVSGTAKLAQPEAVKEAIIKREAAAADAADGVKVNRGPTLGGTARLETPPEIQQAIEKARRTTAEAKGASRRSKPPLRPKRTPSGTAIGLPRPAEVAAAAAAKRAGRPLPKRANAAASEAVAQAPSPNAASDEPIETAAPPAKKPYKPPPATLPGLGVPAGDYLPMDADADPVADAEGFDVSLDEDGDLGRADLGPAPGDTAEAASVAAGEPSDGDEGAARDSKPKHGSGIRAVHPKAVKVLTPAAMKAVSPKISYNPEPVASSSAPPPPAGDLPTEASMTQPPLKPSRWPWALGAVAAAIIPLIGYRACTNTVSPPTAAATPSAAAPSAQTSAPPEPSSAIAAGAASADADENAEPAASATSIPTAEASASASADEEAAAAANSGEEAAGDPAAAAPPRPKPAPWRRPPRPKPKDDIWGNLDD